MQYVKRIVRIFLYTCSAFFGVALLYLVCAIILSVIPVNRHPEGQPEVHIYLLTNGVHSDIAIPIKNAECNWGETLTVPDSTFKYLAFGWGDKNIYINTPSWAHLKLSVALKALSGLSPSALHVTFYRQLTENPHCVRISISQEQYLKLVHYLKNSFKKDSNNHIIQITPPQGMYGPNELFFDATRSYNIFYTCNTWTNNALKTCGQKACLWTPFDKGIFYQYR